MEGQAGLFAKRWDRFTLDEHPDISARVMAIGIGGVGCKAVHRMVEARIQGVELAAVDTDIQELKHSNASIKLEIGRHLTRSLGCCGNPQLGRKAALDEAERILDLIKGFDMIFVVGGEGGGTFTGAAPIFAGLAGEVGALAVAAATMPFSLQGLTRRRYAEVGIQELREAANAVIAVPGEDLHRMLDNDALLGDSVSLTEDLFCRTVRDLAEIVTKPGILKVEFCDLRAALQKRGVILIGTGISEGPNRAVEAVQRAITNPMLDDMPFTEAKSVLINVAGSRQSLRLYDAKCAARIFEERANLEDMVIGAIYDDSMGERLKVTVIASGPIRDTAEQPAQWNSASAYKSKTDWEELDRPAFRRRRTF